MQIVIGGARPPYGQDKREYGKQKMRSNMVGQISPAHHSGAFGVKWIGFAAESSKPRFKSSLSEYRARPSFEGQERHALLLHAG